jgi:hypothetical protein
MSGDTSKLTRRGVLGSIATIGAAGAVGIGTWATSRDSERERVVVQAGGPQGDSKANDDLDLRVEEQEGVIEVDAGTLPAGGTFTSCKTLSNTGSTPGNVVYVTIPESSVESAEGKGYDEETNTDESDGGELDEHLFFRAYLAPEDTESNDEAVYFFHGNADSYVSFDGVPVDREGEDGDGDETYGAFVSLPEEDLQPIVDGQAYEFCFELFYRPEGSRDALGDSLSFDVELVLSQANGKSEENGTDNEDGEDS